LSNPAQLINGSFSYSLWLKASSLAFTPQPYIYLPIVYDISSFNTSRFYLIFRNTNRFDWGVVFTSNSLYKRYYKLSQPLVIDTWVHFGLTYDQSTGIVNMYVNGIIQTPDVVSNDVDGTVGIMTTPTMRLYGSAPGTDSRFLGSIDDFRIYPRALSTNEMTALVNE
jgi:hypothetical protein